MTVYVDTTVSTRRSRCWPFDAACHMVADTPEELEDMAGRIGLRPAWRQATGTWREHYDLHPARRAAALRAGAVEITRRELVRLLRRRRPGHMGA